MSHFSFNRNTVTKYHQRGAAFIVMLVIVIMGITTVLTIALSKVSLQTERNNKSSDMLAQSKEALIGYAVNGGSRPGDLPYQDRLVPSESSVFNPAPTPTPDYDGDQDGCPGLSGCLGRLPWLRLGMSISTPSENDPTGVMPWYAVSANMVDPSGVAFNSDLLTAAPHPWLTVRDMSGNVLSDRVAFIAFIPGPPINGQTRPASPNLGGAGQYLEGITVDAGCTPPCVAGNYSNADANEDFIIGEEHRWINDPANPGKQIEDPSYHFNDKLIYVTIDELMPLIEKRVGGEIKNLLNTYYSAWGAFPFAANFNPLTSNYIGQVGTLKGLLPIGNLLPNSASLAWETSPAPHLYINGVDSATCYYSNGAVTNSRLRCLSSETTIPAGNTVTFTGKLYGVGQGFWRPHNINSTSEFRVRDKNSLSVLASSKFDNISITNTLNADGSATITFFGIMKAGTVDDRTIERIEFRDIQRYTAPTVPAWLFSQTSDSSPNCNPAVDYCNDWHKVAYYSVAEEFAPGGDHTCTSSSCLTVSGQGINDKRSIVIMTSGELTSLGQTHPQSTVVHYLEDENVAPADFVYENKPRTNSFNDQVIIVAP